MIKTKIFFGTLGTNYKTADLLFNNWIEENPNIEILHFRYQQARMGDHSICILYRELPPTYPQQHIQAPPPPAWQPIPPRHYDEWPPTPPPVTPLPWVEPPIVTCQDTKGATP